MGSGRHVGTHLERATRRASHSPKLSPGYVVRLPEARDIAVSEERERFEGELARVFPHFGKPAIEFFRALDRVAETGSDDSVEKLLAQAPADFRFFLNVQLQAFGQCTSTQCSATRAAQLLVPTRAPVWSIDGGGQELANRLAQSLKASGGTIRLNAPVLRLAYASDGVPVGIDLLSGERVLAKRAIISNLTVWDTYGKLVGPGRTPKAIAAEIRNLHAWGAYLLFLSMDEDAQNRLAARRMLVAPSGDTRSIPRPVLDMWLWVSFRPGTTVRPPRSITLLGTQLLGLGPGPITVNLPSWIMTEDTILLAPSIVWMTPFCRRTQ